MGQVHRLIAILTVCAGTLQQRQLITCPKFFKEIPFEDYSLKDKTVKKVLETLIAKGEQFHKECPLELVKAGLFDSAELLIKDHFLPAGVHLENFFKFGASSLKTKLDALHKVSLMSGKSVQLQPAFKWGQSQEEIIMFVKFTNRLDSPGCNDVEDRKVEIKDEATLSLSARGILAGSLVEFNLTFPLFTQVWGNSVKMESAGVGATIVKFKKRRIGIWPQIWEPGYPKIASSGVWWDLKGEEYDSAMASFYSIHQKMDSREEFKIDRDESPSIFTRIGSFFRGLFNRFFNFS